MMFTRRAASHLHSRGAAISTSATRGGRNAAIRKPPQQSLLSFRRGKATAVSSSEASAATAATKTRANASSGVPIAASLAAAAAGVATVSVAAAATEIATSDSVPPYTPTGQRFDQGSFAGRFFRMLLQCDPRLLCYTESQVLQAKELIEQYGENDTNSNKNDRALWEARRLVESALNDQGEFVPPPFRMSGYVAFNGPVCVAMVASQSTTALLFWSWANQSQNALVNYFNRNTSSGALSNETLVKSYAAAVGSALLVAFGLATAIQKKYSADKAKQLLRWVAFPSAVVASSLNCYIVRSPEIDTGVPLTSQRGENVLPGSTSQVAAAQGVYSTTASRAILQAPVYFLPPVLLATIGPITRYLAKNPTMTVPVTTYLLLTSFGIGLPATVAIFPQISSIPAHKVEERFQHLRDPQTQQPYQVFYYNKGL